MSSPICMLLALFLSSFFLIPSPTNAEATPSNLLEVACNTTLKLNFNPTQCVETLNSIPTIASASDFSSLPTAIIERGISNATNIYLFIENELNSSVTIDPARKKALHGCLLGYKFALFYYYDALDKINATIFYKASASLMEVGLEIKSVEASLNSNKVQDLTISTEIKFSKLFVVTSREIVIYLKDQSF